MTQGAPAAEGGPAEAPRLPSTAGIPAQRATGGPVAANAVPAAADPPAASPAPARLRPWRLLPTPTGTPFTFVYALVLLATSLFAQYGDAALVEALQRGSSTDVEHLTSTPLLVLFASALWIAGGLFSGYALVFPFVLGALERHLGALRTAAVFFGVHVLATLATEIPVGLAVALGELPESALRQPDYGISFGVMACTGALTGLLPPWIRRAVLALAFTVAVSGILVAPQETSGWGHTISLLLGTLSRPLIRRSPARRG